MKAIDHKITHQYQPTLTTCSQTALSMILARLGQSISPLELEKETPHVFDKDGNDAGSINQHLATWCASQGYKVSLYTFDTHIIDQSWAGLDRPRIIERLEVSKGGRPAPGLGDIWSDLFRQAYIDYLHTDGDLMILPYVSTALLYSLLEKGPVLPVIAFSTLYGSGKTDMNDKFDDVNGKSWNHSIVIYGVDWSGNFLIADPLKKPGFHTIEPERMIAAISSAQTECDNLIIQVLP